jgi:hypothetical protein
MAMLKHVLLVLDPIQMLNVHFQHLQFCWALRSNPGSMSESLLDQCLVCPCPGTYVAFPATGLVMELSLADQMW